MLTKRWSCNTLLPNGSEVTKFFASGRMDKKSTITRGLIRCDGRSPLQYHRSRYSRKNSTVMPSSKKFMTACIGAGRPATVPAATKIDDSNTRSDSLNSTRGADSMRRRAREPGSGRRCRSMALLPLLSSSSPETPTPTGTAALGLDAPALCSRKRVAMEENLELMSSFRNHFGRLLRSRLCREG